MARLILYSKDTKALEDELKEAKDKIKHLGLWRKQGPIGKLYNIIVYILSTSPQREQQFKEFQHIYLTTMLLFLDGSTTQTTWKLILNVNTRWNSTFDIIKRALHLIAVIDAFIKKE